MHHASADPRAVLEAAQRAFHQAQFASAADLLSSLTNKARLPAARVLAARLELRRGDPAKALAVLSLSSGASKLLRAENAMLQGVAFARLGDFASARTQFRHARSHLSPGDPLNAELTYQIAAAQWMQRRLEQAARTLEALPARCSREVALHASILRGAIASAGENLDEQARILLQTLAATPPDDCDVYLYAMLVTQIASLAVELPNAQLRAAAIDRVPGVRWTRDIADLHFHAVRAIAWRYALDGDEFNAFRHLKTSLSIAASPAWRVAALTDRAYLAAALNEPRWAAQELRDAHELAASIDWASVAGEEKLALPVLADLFASRDPAIAIAYLATFKAVGKRFPRVLSSHRDRRVEALEAYSLGKVQLALGKKAEEQRLLKSAWTIYERLGIRWRAARAALALAEIADAQTWRARARAQLQAYPHSWIARALDRRAASRGGAAEQLTGAQRAVFELLLEGKRTGEIAAALGRSTFTVRNHIKAIFKVFGVSSRPALIVKATSR